MHHHHHDDKTFRGVVEQHGVDKGWIDTNTGGYRPNANSVVERGIGMLNRVFRCLLLVATGGRIYYEQLWGPGLVHANEMINSDLGLTVTLLMICCLIRLSASLEGVMYLESTVYLKLAKNRKVVSDSLIVKWAYG